MNNKGSGTTWAVAVLAIAALAGSLVWGFSQRQQVLSLRRDLTAALQQSQANPETGPPDIMASRRPQENAKPEPQMTPAQSQPPASAAPKDADTPDKAAAAKPDQPSSPMGNMMKMFEGEEGKKLAESSAETLIATQYHDLFTELALPPEAEQKVREIIRDFTVRLIHGSAEVRKNGTEEDVEKFENDLRAEMKKELAKILTNEGMAIYDHYMETMPERMLRKSYKMQIDMYAPSLTEEDRTTVVDVLVEEVMSAREEAKDTPGAAGIAAMERGRQRLITVFDEQQMSQIDAMIQQQRRVYERLQK